MSENTFKEIILNMDLLDEESLNSSQNYVVKCFSAFNHRLGEKEALNKITFYEDAVARKNSPKYSSRRQGI